MKAKQRKTLALIFSRPTPAGVKWADAASLFTELGAEITETRGISRSCVSFWPSEGYAPPAPIPGYGQRRGSLYPEMA